MDEISCETMLKLYARQPAAILVPAKADPHQADRVGTRGYGDQTSAGGGAGEFQKADDPNQLDWV